MFDNPRQEWSFGLALGGIILLVAPVFGFPVWAMIIGIVLLLIANLILIR